MKALDTPVLLALLHGGKPARELARKLRGIEVATTELNLLELNALVARGPPSARAQRREGIDRIRRALTVLPYDAKGADRLSRKAARESSKAVSPLLWGTLGILEANACDEFLTSDPGLIPGKWSFRISKF
jgi:predicted nucleic acid-binding protein